MAPYGPAELGVRQLDQRPYGSNAQAEEMRRERQLTEAQGAPARPISTSQATRQAPRAVPGDMEWQAPDLPTPEDIGEKLMSGLEYITSRGRAAFGALLPGEGEVPFLGERGPTDATQADAFIPAAARWIADAAYNAFVDGSAVMTALKVAAEVGEAATGQEMEAPRLSFSQRHIQERATALIAQGATEDDALRLASLEETYNRLGAVGAVAGGLLLGVPATFAAGVGVAYEKIYGEEAFRELEERGRRRLAPGSLGGAAVEFGIPELGLLTGVAKAFQVSRLRFAAGSKVAAAATDADEAVRLRLDAIAEYQDDLATVERAIPADGVSTEARILRAETAAQRVSTDSVLGPIDDADEALMFDGIGATVEALPAGQRVYGPSVGQALISAERTAKASMFRALRRMLTEGETFRMKNVTVGADAENNAIRVRRMAGTFDEAVERMRNALLAAGRSQEETIIVLAPFLRARAVAAETLTAIERRNAVLRSATDISRMERKEAIKAVRDARRVEAQAEKKVEQTAKAEVKVGEKVEAQQQKETAKVERRTTLLEQRLEEQRARFTTEREIVAQIVGDKKPVVTSQKRLLGYANADRVRFLQDSGVTGVAGMDPKTVDAMYEFTRANPDALTRPESVHWDEITAKTADLTGADLEKIRKNLPATGKMTRTFYVLNQVFSAKLRQWHQMGQAVKAGTARAEQLTDLTTDLLRFQSDLRGGIGEVARTLAQQRLLKKPDAVRLVQLQQTVKLRYADVERIAKRMDALEGFIATEKAAKPLSERVLGLQGELENAVREHETALAALADAKAAVTEAADRNLKAALDYAAKKGATPEQLNVMALYDAEDLTGIAYELRRLEPLGTGQFIQRLAIAGRYGRVPSQLLNFFDTGLNALYQETVVSATAQVMGRGTGLFSPKGEVGRTWMGMWSAAPDATRFWGRTTWQGAAEDIGLRHGVADYESLVGQGLDAPGTHFRLGSREFEMSGPKWLPVDASLRMLYASDGFWRIMLNNGHAVSRAMREGDDIRTFVEAGERVRGAAREQGLFITYNKPYAREGFDAILQSLGKVNVGGFQPLRVFIPAARFGKRYIEQGFENAGYGLIKGARRSRAAEGMADPFNRVSEQRAALRQQAAGAIGTVQLAVGSILVGAGVVTGPMPSSEAERSRWERMGKKPMSLRIPSSDGTYQYIPLGWFGAPAAGLALSAMIVGSATEDDDAMLGDRVARAARGFGQWFIDQPGVYAGRQLLDAAWNATQYGATEQAQALLANVTKPGAASQAAAESFTAVFDKYQRDPEGYLQLLMAKLPGASTLVPPRIDPATGEPMERSVSGPSALLQTEFESAGRTPTDMTDVEKAIVEVGAGVTSMSKTVTSGSLSVRLSGEEYERTARRAGTLGHEMAAVAVKQPVYLAADERARQSIIEEMYARARALARKELVVQMISAARSSEDAQRALTVARSSLDEDQYARMVKAVSATGMLTDDVRKALDESRPSFRSPTVQQIMGDK